MACRKELRSGTDRFSAMRNIISFGRCRSGMESVCLFLCVCMDNLKEFRNFEIQKPGINRMTANGKQNGN